MDPTLKSTAKRLSSLFTMSQQPSASNLSSSSTSSHKPNSSQDHGRHSPSQQNLHTLRATSATFDPVPPPAFFQDLEPPQLPSGRESPGYSSGLGSRPSSRVGSQSNSREGSRSRPQTPILLAPQGTATSPARPSTPGSAKLNKKRSWLPSKGDKVGPEHGNVESRAGSKAWIAGLREHVPYDVLPLINGYKTSDLWNDQGDTLVYLFPKSARKGPSFKIDSSLLDASAPLNFLLHTSEHSSSGWTPHTSDPNLVAGDQQNVSVQSPGGSMAYSSGDQSYYPVDRFSQLSIGRNGGPVPEKHVYIPLNFDDPDLAAPNSQARGDDLELLVLYRNFFAFLLGGALISTPRQVSLYSVFLGISSILVRFEFTNSDGSTYGDVASNSFTRYCDELRLADVRFSREKTVEAIVLGEKMKSWSLYNEGFAHAVGKLEDMKDIHSPKYELISQATKGRLERANHDLHVRLSMVKTKLDDFDFPSMFAGIANSQTATEAKLVRFKAWKASFLSFRRHTVAHYRHKYGAWPPKAKSKKHSFEESGLNRVLLRDMYHDFTDLYDMLVDRNSLTNRTTDMAALSDDAETNDMNESIQHALRRVESEFDRSTPPVAPPIPFDTPLIPSFGQSFNRQHVLIPNKSAKSIKKLKDNEVNEVLLGSYNRESIKATTWVQEFIAFERKTGHGKTMDEIVDMRCGQWLFMYAVLQSLPMTVVDARDLKFTENVEYFLCIPSRGGRPWMKEDTAQSRSWYNVASGGGLVSLPSDMIDHGVEGIYRRSHCWTVATKWASDLGEMSPDAQLGLGGELPLPPLTARDSPHLTPQMSPYRSPHLRPVSPALSEGRISRNGDNGSVHFGLEAIAPPQGRSSRPVSVYNPNTTFDTILGTGNTTPPKKGKK